MEEKKTKATFTINEQLLQDFRVETVKQGKKMSLTDFSSECHRRFDELHEKYFGGK